MKINLLQNIDIWNFLGLLNPLDCLHHFRSDDLTVAYREGIVLDQPTKNGIGAYCNAGLSKVYIPGYCSFYSNFHPVFH